MQTKIRHKYKFFRQTTTFFSTICKLLKLSTNLNIRNNLVDSPKISQSNYLTNAAASIKDVKQSLHSSHSTKPSKTMAKRKK